MNQRVSKLGWGAPLLLIASTVLAACGSGFPASLPDTGAVTGLAPKAEFVGTVDTMSDVAWTISGQAVLVSSATEIHGAISLGDRVKVHASVGEGGTLTAIEIELEMSGLTSTPHTGTEIEFGGQVESITPDSWRIGGVEVAITPQTEIKDPIVVGDVVKVHAWVESSGALMAREIELEHDDDPALGTAGEEIEFYGVVEAMAEGTWTVRGRTLTLTPATEIEGVIEVGDFVKVHALVAADGSLTAREIELASSTDVDGEDNDDDVDEDEDHDGSDDDSDHSDSEDEPEEDNHNGEDDSSDSDDD